MQNLRFLLIASKLFSLFLMEILKITVKNRYFKSLWEFTDLKKVATVPVCKVLGNVLLSLAHGKTWDKFYTSTISWPGSNANVDEFMCQLRWQLQVLYVHDKLAGK